MTLWHVRIYLDDENTEIVKRKKKQHQHILFLLFLCERILRICGGSLYEARYFHEQFFSPDKLPIKTSC